MKLLFVLGSRGEWGYIRPIIELAQTNGHEPAIWACNMSVLDRFGNLIEEITKEGYPVVGKALTSVDGDTNAALAKSFGLTALSATDWLANNQYDWVVIAGDRVEQVAFVVSAAILRIPICHIQAGERSGNIDGMSRHAIARYSHLHFAANEDAVVRLIKSGEDENRVHLTGAPQLDDIELYEIPSIAELIERKIVKNKEFILAVMHGVTEEEALNEKNIQILCEVLSTQTESIIWIGSNNDTGTSAIRGTITSSLRAKDMFYSNIHRLDYLALLKHSKYLIGNSSSGILEAPSFGKPVINLGNRQRDRVRGVNVIDAEFSRMEILKAMDKAVSLDFLSIAKQSTNPYGDGQSSARILEILEKTEITPELLNKQISY
jgi:GDP/UDP-N,N'-diacetylbacillosamine 2-epimerase (hydrolysing)